jgi:hypothetical protein
MENTLNNIAPPHARALFYKKMGARNSIASDIQLLIRRGPQGDASSSAQLELLVGDLSSIESYISTLTKVFPELQEEEEHIRQYTLSKMVEKQKQNSEANPPKDKIDGEDTDLYEDGKVVTKFK